MDENCLCQFKVADVKFWLGPAQVIQGRFQLCTSQLPVAGNEGRGVIVSGDDQFMVEGRGGHHARGIDADHHLLGGHIEGMGRNRPAKTTKKDAMNRSE